jgi:hypothetical protein
MPDDVTPDEGEVPAPDTSQETPGSEVGPEVGTPDETPDIDFEQRYNDLRSEFDRRNQQYSQAEELERALSGAAGPEAQAQALSAFGIELENEEQEDFGGLDEFDPDSRIDRLEAMLEEQATAAEQQELEAAEMDYLADSIDLLEQQEGREFSDQEIETLVSIARANPDQDGVPDMELAHQQLNGLIEAQRAAWLESKKSKRVPGSGVAAGKAVDLDNEEARVQWMADRIEAAED